MKFKFLADIEGGMFDAIVENYHEGNASYIYEGDAGDIEVCTDSRNNVEVHVCNYEHPEREYPSIEAAVAAIIPKWREARDTVEESEMDIYQQNGFASEADFWDWKGF